MTDIDEPADIGERRESRPVVDVVIPVRFGAEFLPQAIRSVGAQHIVANVIVVDDGAEQDLAALVAEAADAGLGDACDVTIVPNARRPGIGGARNTGVAVGSAPLLAFLDADDVWPEGRSTVLARALATAPAPAMVFGMVEQFVDRGLSESDLPEPPRPGMVAGGMLIARTTWDFVGEFDEGTPLGEFIDWVARARHVGVAEALIDDVVLRRRIHGDNTTLHRRVDRNSYAEVVRRHLHRQRNAD